MDTYYHGTPSWNRILNLGFDMEAPRRSDPGDFGWGIYLTQSKSRAKAYGTVLKVAVDVSRFALIPNPYFLKGWERVPPVSAEERLFHETVFNGDQMATVNLQRDARIEAAKKVRQVFMGHGYQGIRISGYTDLQ